MKAEVESKRCTGCGACAVICPEVFEMSENAATVKNHDVPAMAETFCFEAARACASDAISLGTPCSKASPPKLSNEPSVLLGRLSP